MLSTLRRTSLLLVGGDVDAVDVCASEIRLLLIKDSELAAGVVSADGSSGLMGCGTTGVASG